MKMSEEELYQYSKSLDMFNHLFKKLKNLHIYRYSKLIDESDKSFACRLAKRTKELLPEEHSEFFELLATVREVTTLYEDKYKEEIFDEQKDKKTQTKAKRRRSCCK